MSDESTDLPHTTWPHPYWGKAENQCFMESELQGGVWLAHLPENAVLKVKTRDHNLYLKKCRDDDGYCVWGHPVYYPDHRKVIVHGSTWGGSMLKAKFVGRGMYLEFFFPDTGWQWALNHLGIKLISVPILGSIIWNIRAKYCCRGIRTARIEEIEEVKEEVRLPICNG